LFGEIQGNFVYVNEIAKIVKILKEKNMKGKSNPDPAPFGERYKMVVADLLK